ncbi:MAG: ABC transporter permease [Oscillospiraceae bacterium]|jgi:simple sugar transport system permease protein|nr:ABC transporter permease [Oscillospiraceae bacterium]
MTVLNFIAAAVLAGAPLLYGTLGEILTEKSGNLNLGVEGMLFMGGVAGLCGSYFYEQYAVNPIGAVSAIIALVCAFLAAAAGAAIYSFLTITLRANQNVTGLALTIFGAGLGNLVGDSIAMSNATKVMAAGAATKAAFNTALFPEFLSKLPVVGKILFSYDFLVYLALLTAVILALFLKKTRRGLNLRAVGENAAAADAAGIAVNRYRYLATIIGGGISGLGGLYIVMNSGNGVGGVWVHNCINGVGWLAVALVIFATWNPLRAILGSLLFGALSVARLYFPLGIPAQIYDMLPYLATIAVLIGVSMRAKRENQPPGALGVPYFRENR